MEEHLLRCYRACVPSVHDNLPLKPTQPSKLHACTANQLENINKALQIQPNLSTKTAMGKIKKRSQEASCLSSQINLFFIYVKGTNKITSGLHSQMVVRTSNLIQIFLPTLIIGLFSACILLIILLAFGAALMCFGFRLKISSKAKKPVKQLDLIQIHFVMQFKYFFFGPLSTNIIFIVLFFPKSSSKLWHYLVNDKFVN